MITPDALYGCHAFCTRNSDTLFRKFLIPFLIKRDTFVTTNTLTFMHIRGRFGVVDNALCYELEGRGFENR
jgi:hypothetical protein